MPEYPNDWNSRRKKAIKRDDYTCANCGAIGGTRGSADLHVHHIVPKSKNGTHDLSNLKTLCKECHKSIHSDSSAPNREDSEKSSGMNPAVSVTRNGRIGVSPAWKRDTPTPNDISGRDELEQIVEDPQFPGEEVDCVKGRFSGFSACPNCSIMQDMWKLVVQSDSNGAETLIVCGYCKFTLSDNPSFKGIWECKYADRIYGSEDSISLGTQRSLTPGWKDQI